MYISYQGQRAVHEERVRATLARAERRRMVGAPRQTGTERAARTPGTVLRALVTGALGWAVHP